MSRYAPTNLEQKNSFHPGRTLKTLMTLVVALGLFLSGCSSLDEAIDQAKTVVPKDWKLVYTELVNDDTAIVFYSRDKDLGAGLFQKDKLGWNWKGSTLGPLVSEPKGIAWRHADLSNESKGPFYIYYGIVNNEDIVEIIVEADKDRSVTATIIEAEDNRIWYAIAKGQADSSELVIKGLSAEGDLLYQFGQNKS